MNLRSNPIYIGIYCIFFLFPLVISGQVGIGTVTPDGVLDVNDDSGTNNYGLVLPRIALTRTDVAAPVLNPQGGNPAIGTVIYNTATTSFGDASVYPGIYVWDGIDWINKFPKRDAQIFKQYEGTDGLSLGEYLRTATTGGYVSIPNMSSLSFTPAYSGTYKVEVSVNFGSGQVDDNGSSTDVGVQKGNFRFTFDGVDAFIPAHAWSTHQGSGTKYYDIWEQTTVVYYKQLVAGTPYSFSLAFDQTDSSGFINSGNSGDGMGWIGVDLPCSVEFIFLE